MLEKIAAIANYADQQGQYDVASELTQLLKNAQFFDAMKVLFDPEAGDVDKSAPFWKRLQRGWQRGKFDKRLGNALAINADRTKLNKTIEKLSGPLKEFADMAAKLYEKVKSGAGVDDYSSVDFKAELDKLKVEAAKMKKLLGRDLKKALDMRNKLNTHQVAAIDKIKGIDPEQKEFLMKLLMGQAYKAPEVKPEDKPAEPGAVAKPEEKLTDKKKTYDIKGVSDEERQEIVTWLAKLPIPDVAYNAGLTTLRAEPMAQKLMHRWEHSPMALKAFFDANPDKKGEGLKLFGQAFGKVFKDISDLLDYEAKGDTSSKKREESVAKSEPAPITPAAGPTPGAIPLRDPESHPDVLDVKKVEKILADEGKGGLPVAPIPPPKPKAPAKPKANKGASATQPEERTPNPHTSKGRLERAITRLGRAQQLRKLADESEDLMDVGFGERFDEDKHVDEDELEFYKGRELEDYPEDDLSPEDDDYVPESYRPEPKREKGKEEQLDDVMNMLLLVEKRIERIHNNPNANPDYFLSDSERLRRLMDEKATLLKLKNELSNLPEGWADDAE